MSKLNREAERIRSHFVNREIKMEQKIEALQKEVEELKEKLELATPKPIKKKYNLSKNYKK